VAAGGDGNLYVSDRGNTIRKIFLATGDVTTLTTSLSGVSAIDTDGAGNLYAAETYTISKVVLATRAVTTIAGLLRTAGAQDGVGSAARFDHLAALVADRAGHLYVADEYNCTIRRVDLGTAGVTTLAGTADAVDWVDGTGAAARFNRPRGLALDGAGSLFVVDAFNHVVRRIQTASGQVTTLAGIPTYSGNRDGRGSEALFLNPWGISSDGAGALYLADWGNSLIRKIDVATGQVTRAAGSMGTFGHRDGRGASVLFRGINFSHGDGQGNVYLTEESNDTVRRVVIATGEVTTIAGAPGQPGSADGRGPNARFDNPSGMTDDGAGNLYVADSANATIRRVVLATGDVTTIAGSPGMAGIVDGVGPAARFYGPQGLAHDGAGNLYVADMSNQTVRRIDLATMTVTTVAGLARTSGYADGVGAAARFYNPRSLLADRAGSLYLIDGAQDWYLRKIVIATGEVTTFMDGSRARAGDDPGVTLQLISDDPDIVGDGQGNIYLSDSASAVVRKIDLATGRITIVVGVRGRGTGVQTGPLPARLNRPHALALLPGGTGVVLADEAALLVARFGAGS
jgi:Cu/Ag efflux protein CusF